MMLTSLPNRLALVFNGIYFIDYIESCIASLKKDKWKVKTHEQLPLDGEYDIILVVGIHLYPNMPFYRKSRVLGIQTEQLPISKTNDKRLNRNFKRYKAVYGYYEKIIEWNPSIYTADPRSNIFIPYGCQKREIKDKKANYDILFVGNVGGSSRRNRLLEKLTKKFNFYPDFSPGFGDRKNDAIHSSKICLNIHYYENCGFESPRIFDYLSRGAFVLSERVDSNYPFRAGIDFEDFSDDYELEEKIRFYLNNKEARQKISSQGYQTAITFNYDIIGRMISLELKRMYYQKSHFLLRSFSWMNSRLKNWHFIFRDNLSLKIKKLKLLNK